MTHSDPIADLLTRIRNAGLRGHEKVEAPWFRFGEEIVRLLADEGWVLDYEVTGELPIGKKISLRLKYTSESGDRVPLIRVLRRVSRPGRRVYLKSKDIPVTLAGLGTGIISTSSGLLSDREARNRRLGGEYVAVVS